MSDLRVQDISEFALIDRLRAALPVPARESKALRLSIGDDAAVAAITSGEEMVVTTDTMTEGVHFRTDWTTWENIGHKAIAVNLSDLAAMGAVPLLATVSLGLTGDEVVSDLEKMYRGMGACAAAHGCVIAGGDITRTPGPLSIAVTAIGETRDRRVLRRGAAAVDDLIWVTGTIGAGAAGLALELMSDDDPRKQATTAHTLRDALHRPEPRVAAGLALARVGVSCAMDLSDGLSGDLPKILRASDIDGEVVADNLPIPAAIRALLGDQATDFALHGGDDFELLFTAPPSMTDQIRNELELVGVQVTMIGQIRRKAESEPQLRLIDVDGEHTVPGPKGWDHFGSNR